ncbi:macrolide-specific efflux system membrane fusion protein [Pseudomonas monsensis]
MKRPRPARRALFAALCLIPVIAVAAWQVLPPGRDALATVQVTRSNIENSVTALGTLQPRRYVDVGAQASGQIQKIHVEAGDTVKEGQLLVEIDPSTQKAKLDAGRFSIENLKAQLQEQRAQHDLARQKYQRQQQLAAGGATREEDVQTARAEVRATQARIDMFQAQIRQAQASLRSDEAELGYTRIFAPMSGTVVAVGAREGQTLNAQQQTPLILRIARLSPMTVWAEVSEADIGHVKPGMTAYFTTLSGGSRRWSSTVRQILPVPPRPLEQNQGGSPTSGRSGSERVVLYTVLLDRRQRRQQPDDRHDRASVLRRPAGTEHPDCAERRPATGHACAVATRTDRRRQRRHPVPRRAHRHQRPPAHTSARRPGRGRSHPQHASHRQRRLNANAPD